MYASTMSYPDIHSCTQSAAENVELKRRLHRLREHRDELQRELNVLKERKKEEDLLRNYVTTRDVYVQTDPRPWHTNRHSQKSEEKKQADPESQKLNKMLTMHSQLMKRYEKEVKQNMVHMESIADLNVRMMEMENRMKEEKEKAFRLEAELVGVRGHTGSRTPDSELRDIVRERNKLKRENKKLREELDGLDESFFDEIEDIKFGFQQSAQLNKEYEKALQKLCHKFGVPYPHPEQAVLVSKKK
ncbi:centrosomal protein of 290 kDa-like isoform X1 [Haliotis cracherodii]|uniref:centrosomal protein of 290 kDa-like isoform X1 n=1 Tax=Haliotis cracherodii TaxID=6455 RepID=UPI0039E87E62